LQFGFLFHNENTTDRIIKVIQHLHGYLVKVDDGENDKLIEERLFGDQLTIERCINAAQSRKNGYDTEERLEGFYWGLADWHAGMKACTVSLCRHLVFTIFLVTI
jgi:hypothetical protein